MIYTAVRCADVAQAVERVLGKDKVAGSNPAVGLFHDERSGASVFEKIFGWAFENISWLIAGIFTLIGLIAALVSREKLAKYVRDARQEWARVTVPKREEVTAHTWVVLVGVGLTALYLFAADLVLKSVSEFLYNFTLPF